MTKMHDNELEIDEDLVRSLIKSQCPQWAPLSLARIQSNGTDNVLFRLGTNYVVRLPRIEWTPGDTEIKINREYAWVPRIAKSLHTPISFPIFKGNPDENYPFPWLIAQWNEGNNPDFEIHNEYELLAKDLAIFLNDFHRIHLKNGPSSRRGIPLKEQRLDQETRNAISQLQGEIDMPAMTALWLKLSTIPYWNKKPVWVHGDFLPGNLVVQNNRLKAVLDFTDVGVGDPACDLVIAWALFNPPSRKIFRENLECIDDNTWERGRGWALSIALIMLPYYKETNRFLATLAKRMISNVTHSDCI